METFDSLHRHLVRHVILIEDLLDQFQHAGNGVAQLDPNLGSSGRSHDQRGEFLGDDGEQLQKETQDMDALRKVPKLKYTYLASLLFLKYGNGR